MASKYLTDDQLRDVLRASLHTAERKVHQQDANVTQTLEESIDSGFEKFVQELAFLRSTRRMRHERGKAGRPRVKESDPPRRSPEDWLVQEIASGALIQLKRVPAASTPAAGPTVRLIVAVATILADRIEAGEIDPECPHEEAIERLRALNEAAVGKRVRKAGWRRARQKLSGSK
jgi:hypothetical protein